MSVSADRRLFFADAAHAGDRSARARATIIALAIALVAIAIWSLTAGASSASLEGLLAGWFDETQRTGGFARDLLIIRDIRMPRVVIGALIGAALAFSGAVMQGLFRNPLADPGLIGVSAGAALGAATMIVLGNALFGTLAVLLGAYAIAALAFVGALGVTFLLYRVSTRQGQTSVATMLLAGMALVAFANGLLGMLIFMADDRQLRDITFWNLGSLAGATWVKVAAVAPVILLSLGVAQVLARGLNALALGEANARYMGVPVQRLKYAAIVAVAAATGCSVAVSGGIGFVGIVVPHLLRLVIGPDNRFLLPASALGGACLLLLADAVARTAAAPAELPIGIVTAGVGAPVFLWILLKRRALLDL